MSNNAVILNSRYQLLNKLGEGGFGVVYLAKDKESNRECVVKQLHSDLENADVVKRLFFEEMKILEKLDHPQIPRLIDFYDDGEDCFLVQEYIRGETIKFELKGDRPWSETKILNFLEQGLQILDYIHRRGVIHRDIKPDNFIRRQDSQEIVLIDFGAVKNFNVEQSHIINPTVAIGTHGYMPSEQARGKPRKNSDIYSLGIIAIQALTGKNPISFKEDEQSGEIIWRPYADIHSYLGDILTQMVRADYTKRYHSADIVLQDLEKYIRWRETLKNTEVNPIPKDVVDVHYHHQPLTLTQNPPILKTITSPRPWSIAFLLFFLVGMLGGGFFYYDSRRVEATIAQLETSKVNQNFKNCIQLTQSPRAKNIAPHLLEQYIGECRLEYAKQQANLEDYQGAIATAQQIPPHNSHYPEATNLIEEWHQAHQRKNVDCPPDVLCICPGPLCPN
ncbi:serine/threonine protein kinase [Cyanobacterium stanieri LEGE 03274]|uniref:non-specific serine/threonine protein kinase n=1 Tax=Cyanobacterium stanieri LEGE 03274 TaxID=1828756 RepID=A0ABR9V1C2_9CHRO|nr:serine/threonine-protein kinase [Cyanobacterium stanieri]MBE9221349.1 serine/threonine protein kinase [Cyanobacterium stanieri LEGE 03274]